MGVLISLNLRTEFYLTNKVAFIFLIQKNFFKTNEMANLKIDFVFKQAPMEAFTKYLKQVEEVKLT